LNYKANKLIKESLLSSHKKVKEENSSLEK